MARYSQEENDILTRVGPGSKMGDLLREYWTPVLRSEALEADGAPRRVKLYGRNYVAFRATDGRVGFLNEGCPHRGASLALGDNRANGLRCIYHGWRFDVDGKVIHVPTEPKECAAAFAEGVTVHHYPVREAGGLVWVFPQEGKEPPKFPDLEFNNLPVDHVDVRIGVFRVNWLQAMESVLDSAHLGQLHRSAFERPHNLARTDRGKAAFRIFQEATAPVFEVEKTPWGFKEGAIRTLNDGRRHVNLRQFVAPYYSFLPSAPTDTRICCISIAHDDEWMSQIIVNFRLDRPLTQEERELMWTYAHPDPNNFAGKLGSVEDMWGQDRAAMKAGYASGFPDRHIFQEDFIVQESMGAIVDRTQENLGSSDTVIIHTRDELIRAALAFADGEKPWGLDALDQFDFGKIRSTNRLLDEGEDWRTIDPIAEYEQHYALEHVAAAE
jgi:phenylpropionate dioxygenase-like ring-hydroxylating dioxygenase large terminal subunit